jgi:hypothetical protein
MNPFGDHCSGAEREIYAAYARHIAPLEHTLPDPGSLLAGKRGVAAPFLVPLPYLAFAFTLAFLRLGLRGILPLPASIAWPILLALFALALLLRLALLARSLPCRTSAFASLPLLSNVALLALLLAGRAFLLVNLALLALSTFLTSLAGRALLTLVADRAGLSLSSLLVLHLPWTAAGGGTPGALLMFLCGCKHRSYNKRGGSGCD